MSAVVQSLTKARASSLSTLQSAAFGTSPTSGNGIIVVLSAFRNVATDIFKITDNQSNTYTASLQAENVSQTEYIFLATNITGGSNFKITATLYQQDTTTPSVSGAYFVFGALEVQLAASPADAGAVNSGSSNGPSVGSITTTNANDIVVVIYGDSSSGTRGITPPSGYTQIVQETDGSTYNACDAGYQEFSSIQTGIDPAWALDGTVVWAAGGKSFKLQVASSVKDNGGAAAYFDDYCG